MTPAEELKGVIGQIKSLLKVDMEMGLDPPTLSSQTLEYLDQRPGKHPIAYTLDDLKRMLTDCDRCKLSRHRTHLVFGEGNPHARLVFVGHGPGDDENTAGRPFVGEAGHLLTRIIEKGMGLSMDDVYLCNIVKCKPPDNRDPDQDEMETCMPFLKQQLQIVKPEVICMLGQTAGRGLLGKDFVITQERGKWRSYMDIPVMSTYHPAYIVKDPSRERELKGFVWKDIQAIMARLGLEVKRDG